MNEQQLYAADDIVRVCLNGSWKDATILWPASHPGAEQLYFVELEDGRRGAFSLDQIAPT